MDLMRDWFSEYREMQTAQAAAMRLLVSSQRAILWQASASGEKSPEGWAATKIYESLEELELATRPGRMVRKSHGEILNLCNGLTSTVDSWERPGTWTIGRWDRHQLSPSFTSIITCA